MIEYRFQIWGRDDVYGCASLDETGALIIYGDEFDGYLTMATARPWRRPRRADGRT